MLDEEEKKFALRDKKKNIWSGGLSLVTWGVAISDRHAPRTTRHNTPIHNILSTAPQFRISQKALGTLSEDGNVMPKHVGANIHN
jgi:hypothetical protein